MYELKTDIMLVIPNFLDEAFRGLKMLDVFHV